MSLPAQASVVVIGGGVMGCSTLYHLARLGRGDALLLERHRLTSGTTWHSAAQVRALRSSRNMTELIRTSIRLYAQLEEETGQSTGWINAGSLSLATSPARLAHIRRQTALAHLFGVRAQEVSTAAARERWPLMHADDVLGAVWSPDDGRVSPSDLCAALVKGAKARGAQVAEETGVTGVISKRGKIVGVETTQGDVRCDAVVLCAGLWSREVAAGAGAEVPLWPCEHFYLLTTPLAEVRGNLPTLSDHDSHLYCRDDSGGLLIGCFEPMGKAIAPAELGERFAFQLLAEDWAHFEPMMENAIARIPLLAQAGVKTLLNGPESFTPDGMFMLGEAAETQNLFLGCGMNSVGVATAGGAGAALAEMIVHGSSAALPEADPKRFPAAFNSAEALAARVPEILGRHYEITFPGVQPATARHLRHLPLHRIWEERRAHFGQFYGWERPLYFNKREEPALTFARPAWFAQVGEEVRAAHRAAALFDSSSLGKIKVDGADAETFLNRVCTNDLSRPPGSVVYTLMLNARGGIVSDLTAHRLSERTYRLFTATGAIKRDLAWLRRQVQEGERVTLTDETEAWAVLALSGPESSAVAAKCGGENWQAMKFFTHREARVNDVAVRVARLSYVGEFGWEITCRAQDAAAVGGALLAAGATPAGVYAQSSMRIEKAFAVWGHELDTDMTPPEAGLDFALDERKECIGSAALRARENTAQRVVTIVLDDPAAVPIGGEPVQVKDIFIGQTTSAAFGYRVQKPVALAVVDSRPLAAAEGRVQVNIAGEIFAGTASTAPAFDPQGKRIRSAA